MNVAIERSIADRRGFRLVTELHVREPREQVFEFFSDAHQLEAITPPWLHFSVQTPAPITMHSGALIDYRLRLHGFPVHWKSRISLWQPPTQFVDEQVKGPYCYWRHEHTFESTDVGTLVRDVVHYAVPLSLVVHPFFVRRDLIRIFEFRRAVMRRMFTPA